MLNCRWYDKVVWATAHENSHIAPTKVQKYVSSATELDERAMMTKMGVTAKVEMALDL